MTYKFELGKDFNFTEVVYTEDNLLIPTAQTQMLEPGQYFCKITATNASGYSQVAFDTYRSDRGKIYGVRCFWVSEDGQIYMDDYEVGE